MSGSKNKKTLFKQDISDIKKSFVPLHKEKDWEDLNKIPQQQDHLNYMLVHSKKAANTLITHTMLKYRKHKDTQILNQEKKSLMLSCMCKLHLNTCDQPHKNQSCPLKPAAEKCQTKI